MRAVWAGDDWNDDEVIDPVTGVWEGQCPRCYVYALEGSHTSTNPNAVLACCHCGWRLDKHRKGAPLGQNGRKHCDLCKWFARGKRGSGKCLDQRLVPLLNPRARWVHPTVLDRDKCNRWRLLERREP
jgi:hypothetical protein